MSVAVAVLESVIMEIIKLIVTIMMTIAIMTIAIMMVIGLITKLEQRVGLEMILHKYSNP